jgi:peptide/nickel transport system permease protein
MIRLARYILNRTLIIFLTVIATVYVTIVLANLGGRVDDIVRARIAEAVGSRPLPAEIRALPPEQRVAYFRQAVAQAEEAAGLNEPFLWRSLRFVEPALTLDLGQSGGTIQGQRGFFPVRAIILDRIPATLLLLGITNFFIFVSSIYLALYLSEQHGRFLDRLIVVLSPTSAVPAWFYGIFLIAFFAGILPTGGMYPSPPPDSRALYLLGMARHMILPFAAIFLSTFFYSVYMWRTFFLIYANEDYVELARAKGVPAAVVRRRYILRPTLPAILTHFALMLLGIWSGSVVLEVVFSWPGLGQLFFNTLRSLNSAVLVGLTVTYAYFLGITLLLLEIAYALVDPRLRVGDGHESGQGKVAGPQARSRRWPWRRRRPRSEKRDRWALPPVPASRPLAFLLEWPAAWRQSVAGLVYVLGRLWRYPSAVIGLSIILLLAGSVVYTVTAVPYQDAIRHWRGTIELIDQPQNARPIWFNAFSRTKLPPTLILDSREGQAQKRVETFAGGKEILLTYNIDYRYDAFPQELLVHFETEYDERAPHVALSWLMPDGREIRLGELSPRRRQTYRLGQDTRLARRLGGRPPQEGLFSDLQEPDAVVGQGTYRLQISAYFFEEEGELDARFVMRGQVYGLAGTDHRGRDLMVGLLWGTPTVLAFGLLGAALTVIGAMILAATGVWFGGQVDGTIQRLTEINMAVPLIPLLAMVTYFYTLRIWTVLAAAILLSIFGSSIKTYRAIFLQVKSAPYVEAALAYGAGNARIIRSYLIPRIAPVLIPQMVTLVPSYVFLEAALAFLGTSDPILPTWGKIIHDAHVNGALLNNYYYWLLQPALLLLLLGFAFAMVGAGLDRILNPRLQEQI